MNIFINAIIFNIPVIILLFWSLLDIFDEFLVHNFSLAFKDIFDKENVIRERCFCNTEINRVDSRYDRCPIFKNIERLNESKHFKDKRGYPFFDPEDVRDDLGLAIELKISEKPVPKYLRNKYTSLSNLLDRYIEEEKTWFELDQSFERKNKDINHFKRFFLDGRRYLLTCILGEWRHPLESKWQELYAYPSNISKRFQYLLAIELNKIIYDETLLDHEAFAIDETITLLFENYKKRKNSLREDHPHPPLQLNRYLLESAFKEELREGVYSNHLWNIVKHEFIFTGKQTHYFEIIVVQLFLLIIEPMKNGMSNVYLTILLLIMVILIAQSFKLKPIDWFMNRYIRLLVITVAFLSSFSFYLVWVEKFYWGNFFQTMCLIIIGLSIINLSHNIKCLIKDSKI